MKYYLIKLIINHLIYKEFLIYRKKKKEYRGEN